MDYNNAGSQQHSSSTVESMLSQFFEESAKQETREASDSWLALQPKKKWIDQKLLLQYQEYPTTQQYIKAANCYVKGAEILENYGKESVDSVDDCRFLKPAFRNFVDGYIYENSLFPPEMVKIISAVITKYLDIVSDDFIAEFLHFAVLSKELSFEEAKTKMSDYERMKIVIRTGEKLSERLKSLKMKSKELQIIRGEIYFLLGSKYSLSDQPERAVDSFEKCYKVNKENHDALYGIACLCIDTDTDKAIRLFNEYLQTLTKCAKKYPHVFYQLAMAYLNRKEIDEAFRCYEMAEQAETNFHFYSQLDCMLKKVWNF